MSQIVHVIHPSGSPRWERQFRDGVPPDQILADLRSFGSKVQIGFVGTVVKTDAQTGQDVPHSDVASGYVMDHPETVVAIGHVDGNDFVEDRRIAGPPARVGTAPETAGAKTSPRG